MRSMPNALLWEMLSHLRWSLPGMFLLAIMLPILMYAALSGISLDPGSREFVVLQFAFLPIVIFQLAIGVALAHGPVSRLYALPISTNSIVAWHMFSGAVFLAVETAAVAWLLNTLFGVDWPILGATLFAAAVWSALQLLMSISRMQSLPAVFLAGFPGVFLCLWLASRYGSWFSQPKHPWSIVTPIEVFSLFCAFGICYVMTNYSVGFARCGERIPTLGILSWLDKQWEAFSDSRSSARFHSAAEAQLWLEWQVKGIALPLITLIMLIFASAIGLVACYIFQTITSESLYQGALFLGGFLSALALPVGLVYGLEMDVKSTGQRETQLGDSLSDAQFESGMGSFLSSRPFTSRDFSNAILRTAAQSSLIAWLMWFVVLAACLLILWLTNHLPNFLLPRETGLLFIPITILGPWAAMTNIGSIGLTGRGPTILFALITSFIVYCVVLGLIHHFTNALVVQQLHTVCTTVAAVLIVIATFCAYFQAQRHRHVTVRTLMAAVLVAGGLVTAAVLFRPADAQFIFYPMAIAFVALVVVPFATVPLAISWNRHR